MIHGIPRNLGNLVHESVPGSCEVLVDTRVEAAPVHLTAHDVREATRAFARGLRKVGIKRGDRVAFLSANRWELLTAYLGTMLLGAVAVPVNYKLPVDTVRHILDDAEASIIFFDAERETMVPAIKQSLGFDENGGQAFQGFLLPGHLDPYEPTRYDLAEILYTSGSTGPPKGVPLTHAGQLWALGEYLEHNSDAPFSVSTIVVAPMYHMNAIFFTSMSLINRVRPILMPRFNARQYIEAVSHFGCAMLTGVPTMFALVAALPRETLPADLGCVKLISVGSAPLSHGLLEQVRTIFPEAEVRNGYGSTEAGPAIFGPHPDGLPTPALSIGYPRRRVSWRLVGGDSPAEGRLQLRTPAMTQGYLNSPESTEKKFLDGWFDTGDILRQDELGFMYFVSRADDMFVCGGENIYPSQVETLLTQHPAVLDAVVVGAPDDLKGAVPIAFVVLRTGTSVKEEQLREHCLVHGPAYAHPRRILFKSSLPLGGTQKIDRRALAKEAETLMVAAGRASQSLGAQADALDGAAGA